MNTIMRIIPTRKQVKQLHAEAVRLRKLADDAFLDFHDHKAPLIGKVPLAESYAPVHRLYEQARAAYDAYLEADNAHYNAVEDWLGW